MTDAEVKAEFLERFTRFVEWPADRWPDDTAPFVICLAGRSPLNAVVVSRAREWRIKGRRVEVREESEPQRMVDCDLLVVAASESSRLEWLLERTARRPILTVGDGDGFGRRGVIVNFFLDAEVVRFEVNQRAVEASGLELSSRLLKLARLVESPR